jgi:hypothetical protein
MKTSRIVLAIAALVVLGIGIAGFAYIRSMRATLELGVGYGARVACACRYIGNRELKSCYADFEPGMEPIRLKDDPATKTVTAYVPLIASRAVSYDPVLGCQPEPFAGKAYVVKH